MNFIRQQIKHIRTGGLPVLWKKIRAFPRWLGTNKFILILSLNCLKIAVAIKPDWFAANAGLGEALTGLKRFDEAVICWKKVVSLKPDWPLAHERLGDALLSLDRFDEGIVSWRKAISLQPDDRYPELYRRSVALLHRGQADAMMNILCMGIETQEEFAKLHQLDRLGLCFLREWTYAIGHMALLDFYVKMGILGWRHAYHPIVLDVNPANQCYLDYWRHYLPDMITDPEGVKLLTPLASRLEDHLHVVAFGDGRKIYHMAAALEVQEQWESEGRGPLLTLSDDDHDRGWDCLKRLGIPPNAWFVGMHIRDDSSGNVRDADIDTYRMAIESIEKRGGWVIRMGNPSMPPLPSMPQVIDYAHSEARSDWMDVFLWARCRFFIGTRSGPSYVPPTFGVPCVLTNSFPMAMPFPYHNIGIFKLYWSEIEERYLTFSEAFASRVELAEGVNYIASLGIRPVDNTPEEINDVVLEMLERLEGTLVYSTEDEQFQERFKSHRPNFKNELGTSAGRVGRAFLRKYAHLL